MHAWAIGVEYPRYLDADLMLSPVVEKQRFGTAFAFIVARAHADRVDVAPILFRLRVNCRITIDLRSGSLQNLRAQTLGEAEHIYGPVDTRFRRLHGIVLIMNRGGGAGEIVDFVNFDIERKCDVMAHQFKPIVVEQMFDVPAAAGEEIIDTQDVRALA